MVDKMVKTSPGFRIRKGYKVTFSQTPNISKPIAPPKANVKEFKAITKQSLIKRTKATTGVFPGLIQNSKDYMSGTPGLFIQYTKGMEGKDFIGKGIARGLQIYLSED